MTTNIILAVSSAPVWFILYFVLLNNAKPKKNIILGVTLPYEAHKKADTLAICRSFRRTLTAVMLPLLLLLTPLFFLDTMAASMTWFMTWLIAAIVAPYAVFAVYRGKMMTLKRRQYPNSKAAGRLLADVKVAAALPRKVGGFWFFLSLLLSLVPVAVDLLGGGDRTNVILYAIFALMIPLFWFSHHIIYRTRSDVVNENTSLSIALTGVRRYNWSKFFLLISWLTALLNLMLWLLADNGTLFTIAVPIYTALLVVASLQTEFAVRKAQQELTAQLDSAVYADEDEHWILGLFYYNPNDNHFLVNDRVGMNMSMNLARPAAKVIMVFSVLCLAVLPFIGVWIGMTESTPTTLILGGTTVVLGHTGDEYVVELSQISSVELTERLPSMTRTMGTGLDNLLKGNFNVKGYGNAKLCLQPKNPPFMIIVADGVTYFCNDANSEVTRSVYDALLNSVLFG